MWYWLAEDRHHTSEERHFTLCYLNQSFHLPHVWVDSGYIISRKVDESHGGLWDELMAGLTRIRCLNYLDRRETAFKFFDVMASMCWMTLLQAGRCKIFWERLLGLGKRSWKRRFKRKEEILPMQMASVNALKLDLDQFYFSIRKFRGDSKPKLRLSSKAVSRWRLK